VLVVEAVDFMSFIGTHPQAGVVLLRMISDRLRDADRRQVEFGALDTVEGVIRRLVELARTEGSSAPDGDGVFVAIAQQELVAWTGASREAVNKALAVLRAPGWISTRRTGIVLHDLAALELRCR